MRLIDADALLNEADGDSVSVEKIKNAPAVDAVVLPAPIGSDIWWVYSEDLTVQQDKGGICGYQIFGNEMRIIGLDGESLELHGQWGCLSKEEAEAFREKLLAERN